MSLERKIHLRGGVYAEHQDGVIVLTTENGYGASPTIILEPKVYIALTQFVKRERSQQRKCQNANVAT
jgi:hypothetical protein